MQHYRTDYKIAPITKNDQCVPRLAMHSGLEAHGTAWVIQGKFVIFEKTDPK